MSVIVRLPRGVRANNPGNIRKSKSEWRGEINNPHEKDFESFATPEDGLRALMVLLLNYQSKYKLDTIRKLIHRWAPPIENVTSAYVNAVSRKVGVGPDKTIDLRDQGKLISVAKAIANHENGHPPSNRPDGWFPSGVYVAAAKRAYAATGNK